MEQILVFRTKQGLDFTNERQAQLTESILDALDRFFAAEPARQSGAELLAEIQRFNDEADAEIAEIKAQMAERKLSGRKLAKKAGISPGTLSGFLRGAPCSDNIKRKVLAALEAVSA